MKLEDVPVYDFSLASPRQRELQQIKEEKRNNGIGQLLHTKT